MTLVYPEFFRDGHCNPSYQNASVKKCIPLQAFHLWVMFPWTMMVDYWRKVVASLPVSGRFLCRVRNGGPQATFAKSVVNIPNAAGSENTYINQCKWGKRAMVSRSLTWNVDARSKQTPAGGRSWHRYRSILKYLIIFNCRRLQWEKALVIHM